MRRHFVHHINCSATYREHACFQPNKENVYKNWLEITHKKSSRFFGLSLFLLAASKETQRFCVFCVNNHNQLWFGWTSEAGGRDEAAAFRPDDIDDSSIRFAIGNCASATSTKHHSADCRRPAKALTVKDWVFRNYSENAHMYAISIVFTV